MAVAGFGADVYTIAEGETAVLLVVRTDDVYEIAKSVWLELPDDAPLTVQGLDGDGVLWLPDRETEVRITADPDDNHQDDTYEIRLVARGGVTIGSPGTARLRVIDRQDVPAVPLGAVPLLALLLAATAWRRLVRDRDTSTR